MNDFIIIAVMVGCQKGAVPVQCTPIEPLCQDEYAILAEISVFSARYRGGQHECQPTHLAFYALRRHEWNTLVDSKCECEDCKDVSPHLSIARAITTARLPVETGCRCDDCEEGFIPLPTA